MARALVLNITYEPLSVVSERRAVVLALLGQVDVVSESGRRLRSERLEVNVPDVVRLRRHVRAPRERRAALNRRAVFARDGHRCQYCDGPAESLDHVVPRSRGGPHRWENVVAACRACNVAKRDRLLAETGMRLQRRPEPPRHLSWLLTAVGDIPPAWRPWVDRGRLII